MTVTVIESTQARDRKAISRVVARAGYGHALDSLMDAVVSEVVSDTAPDADERMAAIALEVEGQVLDALAGVARKHGWKAS